MSDTRDNPFAALAHGLSEAAFEADLAALRHPERDPVQTMHRRARARTRAYRATLPHQAKGELPAGPAATLARAAAAREAMQVAQVAELSAAADWATLHPAPLPSDGRGTPCGGEQAVAVAGEGAPLMAEFAIPELALRLGVATDSGRLLIGDAVELVHRLPRTWATLRAGGVPAYKARRVAQATRTLNPDAAAYVDAEVAPYLHAVGVKALEAIVETAIWRHDLPRALAEARESLDRRGVRIHLDRTPCPGTADATVEVSAHLDRADAVELEAAICHLAHQLLLAGSTETLEVRRSQALGMLARSEAPVEVPVPGEDLEEWDEPQTESATVQARRRDLVLHVHLSTAALRGAPGLARLEGHAGPVTTEQVRSWCLAPGSSTRLTIKPVIDLEQTLTVGSYEVPTAVAEHAALRDRSCVFPHCTRDARRCNADHIDPWVEGGATSTVNVAPLCRRHHRLKTHGEGWSYRMLHPGTYLWTTPRGQHVLRDPAGTHAL